MPMPHMIKQRLFSFKHFCKLIKKYKFDVRWWPALSFYLQEQFWCLPLARVFYLPYVLEMSAWIVNSTARLQAASHGYQAPSHKIAATSFSSSYIAEPRVFVLMLMLLLPLLLAWFQAMANRQVRACFASSSQDSLTPHSASEEGSRRWSDLMRKQLIFIAGNVPHF